MSFFPPLNFSYFCKWMQLKLEWRWRANRAAASVRLSWGEKEDHDWAGEPFKAHSSCFLLIHHAPVWVGRSVSSTLTRNSAGRKTFWLFPATEHQFTTKTLQNVSAYSSSRHWRMTSSYHQKVNLMSHYYRSIGMLLLMDSHKYRPKKPELQLK